MAAQLPFPKRIEDAINRIGKHNGTRIPDCTPPKDLSNEEADKFVQRHEAIRDALIAQILNRVGEAKWKSAKAKLLSLLPDANLQRAGESKAFVFDNVSLGVRSQRSGARVNKARLITKLVAEQKLTFEAATAFVEACEDDGVSLFFSPATVAE